jgi:hypothetical protein
MKTYKKKTVKVIDQVLCDCCGQSTTNIEQIGPDYATLESCWGYGSPNDGVKYDIQLCENCFYDILKTIRQKRQKTLGIFKYPHDVDPLNGITF